MRKRYATACCREFGDPRSLCSRRNIPLITHPRNSSKTMSADHLNQLQKIFELQANIQDIHPFLEKLFPIVVAEDGQFLIYDAEPHLRRYALVQKTATPMPIPQGVRAAFPLESYQSRMVCVVTGEVFDHLEGYSTIFHEFIHCQQAECCEQRLKQTLEVARQAQAAHDPMWEINHPFPYAAPGFVQLYQAFLGDPTFSDMEKIRHHLLKSLARQDYEYMLWQEWKEGFARAVENRVRRRLGLPENRGGKELPFSRVSFYAGGEHFIEILEKRDSAVWIDIEALFERMIHI